MARAKPKAKIMVSDGQGEMVGINDRRFEKRNWPIQIEIPKEQADTWLQYFSAECTKRGWGAAGISQPDAKENSGNFTVTTSENESLQQQLNTQRDRVRSKQSELSNLRAEQDAFVRRQRDLQSGDLLMRLYENPAEQLKLFHADLLNAIKNYTIATCYR